MRAVRCAGDHVEVVDVPEPRGEGVRVRIHSAGICGSDLHLVGGPIPIAATLGHEMAGTAPDGRPVAIEPIAPCGACSYCLRGDTNLCTDGPSIIYGTARDGGMADEILVPERCLVPLPSGVRLGDACLVEPLAVAVHGLRRAGFRGGQRVAVIGGGAIGLCAVAAARHAGAETALEARHDAQRAVGARLQATEPVLHYDLVIDAAGTRSSLERAVELCRPGGTLLLLATYWAGLELPGFALCMKEVTVVPASLYGQEGSVRDIDAAAAILAARPELGDLLITHRYPLDAAPEAFRTAADRAGGAIKVVLEP
ncbi:MAG: alcohol dehydrogenase catalytic domain-containing protein [Proteobacteria bacterium]|nr:alcohol dehydrogenase catalytic domain-containing protein [Pseudomonadota bacterium]